MATETSSQTRMLIVQLKQQALSFPAIAQRLGLSLSCVKKFYYRFCALGEGALARLPRRPHAPHPRATSDGVRRAIIETKRLHPNWGGQFIQGELRRRRFRSIPHRKTIERILYRREGFSPKRLRHNAPVQNTHQVAGLHQLWQIDFIVEKQVAGAPKKRSFLNMRDVASRLSILKYSLPRARAALTSRETIAVCRKAFAKWGVLPTAIRTDHGACFVGAEPNAFPSPFTLYLRGLGSEHELIAVRRPTQNAVIERDQGTLATHFLADYQFSGEERLQQDVENFGDFHNRYVPSRSRRCQGRTAAATAARLPACARAFTLSEEESRFDRERVFAKLATLEFKRLVSATGYIHLGGSNYYVGQKYRRQQVRVSVDGRGKEFVCHAHPDAEVKRWPARGLSYSEIVKDRRELGKTAPLNRSRKMTVSDSTKGGHDVLSHERLRPITA